MRGKEQKGVPGGVRGQVMARKLGSAGCDGVDEKSVGQGMM